MAEVHTQNLPHLLDSGSRNISTQTNMAAHEYSIFRPIANHQRDKKDIWGTATLVDPMQGIDAWAFRDMRMYRMMPLHTTFGH